MIYIRLGIFLALFASAGLLEAQLPETQKLADDYTESLRKHKLDKVLKVRGISERKGYWFLELKLNYQSSDSASAAWSRLQSNMLTNHNMIAEDFLFYRFWKFSKKSPDSIAVYIKDTYTQVPCLFVAVYFDSESRVIKTKQSNCLSETERVVNLQLNAASFGGTKIIKLPKSIRREAVYNKILRLMKRKYRKRGNFSSKYIRGDDELEFQVHSIKNEIITEDNQWFCELINWLYDSDKCDMRPYEYIRFKIRYEESNSLQAKLVIKIDARYAPVYGKYKQWNYCTPVDLQFTDAMESYADKVRVEIFGFF